MPAHSSHATASPGESYVSPTGATWTDLTTYYSDTNVCLKGYTEITDSEPVTAGFTADVTSGIAPLTVTFTDTSTGSRIGWNWTFGDGDTTNATRQNPVHTYTASGTYDVSLEVYNATSGSDSIQKSGYITSTAIIEQGDTIFIGDEGLNVTHALNGAYFGASCGVDMHGDAWDSVPISPGSAGGYRQQTSPPPHRTGLSTLTPGTVP